MFVFTPSGAKLYSEIIEFVQENGYDTKYAFDNIPIARIEMNRNSCLIHINNDLSDIQKEMALLHELLHIKQRISGVPMRDFKGVNSKDYEEYYNQIQGFILDAPIHKELTAYGYDLTLITKEDRDALFQYYSGTCIKPQLLRQRMIPLLVAGLYYSFSSEAYEHLMLLILLRDECLYSIISTLNATLKDFVDNNITFDNCFQSVIDLLEKT